MGEEESGQRSLENIQAKLDDFNTEVRRQARLGGFFVGMAARGFDAKENPILELYVGTNKSNFVVDLPKSGWQQELIMSALPQIADLSGKNLGKFKRIVSKTIDEVSNENEMNEEELKVYRMQLGEKLSKM